MTRKIPAPLPPTRFPNRVSLSIRSRVDEELDALPKDGSCPGLDAPFSLPMDAGKGEEKKLSPRVKRL